MTNDRHRASDEPDSGEIEVVPLSVDGHEFLMTARSGQPGAATFRWLTGPHEYGFSSRKSDGAAMTIAEAEAAIRDFLAQIDPTTGYIE